MDRPTPPRDPAEAQLALAHWLSRQVAPPWSPREPGALEREIGGPVELPEGAPMPRGFGGVRMARATAAARWAGPVFGTEVGPMAWADQRTLVCGGQDGQVFALQLDEAAHTWWPRLLGRQAGAITHLVVDDVGRRAVCADAAGGLVIWDLSAAPGAPPAAQLQGLQGAVVALALSYARSRVMASDAQGSVGVWPLEAQGTVEGRLWAAEGLRPLRFAFDVDNYNYLAGTVLVAGVIDGAELVFWTLHDDRHLELLVRHRLEQVGAEGRSALWPLHLESLDKGRWLYADASVARICSVEGVDRPIWFTDPHRRPIVCACMHRHRQRVILGLGDGQLQLGRASEPEGWISQHAHGGAVVSLGLSDDGRWLASAGADGTLRLWDVGKDAFNVAAAIDDLRPPPHTIALDPEGHRLAAAGGDLMRLWTLSDDAGAKREHFAWAGPRKPLRLIAQGEAASQLATAGEDGSVWLWSLDAPEARPRRLDAAGAGWLGCLEMSPDGRYLLGGRQDGAFWRIDFAGTAGTTPQGQVFRLQPQGVVNRMALDPTRDLVAMGGDSGVVTLWRIGANPSDVPLNAWRAHHHPITKLYFMPGPRVMVSCSAAGQARWWLVDAAGRTMGARAEVNLTDARVSALIAPPASELLFGATSGGRLLSWRLQHPDGVATEAEVQAHEGEIFHLALLADGRLLSSGADGIVRLWSTLGGVADHAFGAGPTDRQPVRHFGLSPDQAFMATACDDGDVRLWNLQRPGAEGPVSTWNLGRPVRRLLWHRNQVAARFDGGWCHWTVAAEDASAWQVRTLVLQLDGETLLRLSAAGIELIRDRPIATDHDAEGRLLPADPATYGRLVFADAPQGPRKALQPTLELFDAWQLASRLQWPADEDPPRRLRVRWADEAERERWLPRELRGAPPVRSAALVAADDFSPPGPAPAQTDPPHR